MRLAATPELQSLFLISERDGSTFLSETAKHLVLEQAARTTQFLADLPEPALGDVLPSIEQQLGLVVNPDLRLDKIRALIREEITDPRELTDMLWQEVVISDTLRRFLLASPAKPATERQGAAVQDLRDQIESQRSERANLEREVSRLREELAAERRTRAQLEQHNRALEERFETERAEMVRAERHNRKQEKRAARETRRQLEQDLREEIKAEIEPELRDQLASSLRHEIRAKVSKELRPQIREELTLELTPPLSKKIRASLTEELTPAIREELIPKLRKELEPQIRAKLSAQFESEKVALRSRIEAELEPVLEKKLTRTLTPAIRREIEPQLRQELAVEIARTVTKTVRAELNDEYQQKFDREVEQMRRELTSEISAEQRKIAEAELRPVLSQKLRRELGPKLEEKIRSRLIPELRRSIAKELQAKIREELREEMQETIRENVKLDLIPLLTAQIRENLEAERGSDDVLIALFDLVCEALGDQSESYSLDAFVAHTRLLANGVLQITRHCDICFSALLRLIMELEAEKAHLDHLHTHTRALLVGQSHMVAELRHAADPAMWSTWTKKIYQLLTGVIPLTDNLALIRNDIEGAISARGSWKARIL
jgi:hypothetical protein